MARTVDRYEILTGDDAHVLARKKARFGRTDWVAWCGKDGVKRAMRASSTSVKMAMLATGTQGYFTMYQASDGVGSMMSWGLASLLLRNLKYWEHN